MTKDINKLGEEVAAMIKSAETDKARIAPKLREVWQALEDKQEVNGVKTKKEWAKKFGVTMRYCQYLVRDGSRKDQTRTTVRVLDGLTVGLRNLELDAGEGSVMVEFEKARIETYKGTIKERRQGDWSDKPADKNGVAEWNHKVREIHGNVSFDVEDAALTEKQLVAELLKKMKSGLRAMHLWDDKLVPEYKEYVKETLDYHAEQKESRSESAKKAAETRKKRKNVGFNPTVRTQTVGGYYAYHDFKKESKGHKAWVLVKESAPKKPLDFRWTREEAEEMVRAWVEATEHPAAQALAAAVDGADVPQICDEAKQ
jgi:hypothetical protein